MSAYTKMAKNRTSRRERAVRVILSARKMTSLCAFHQLRPVAVQLGNGSMTVFSGAQGRFLFFFFFMSCNNEDKLNSLNLF